MSCTDGHEKRGLRITVVRHDDDGTISARVDEYADLAWRELAEMIGADVDSARASLARFVAAAVGGWLVSGASSIIALQDR